MALGDQVGSVAQANGVIYRSKLVVRKNTCDARKPGSAGITKRKTPSSHDKPPKRPHSPGVNVPACDPRTAARSKEQRIITVVDDRTAPLAA